MKEKLVHLHELEAVNLGDNIEFISDSPEQIQRSIRYIGYRKKLNRAFKAAIARVNKAAQ